MKLKILQRGAVLDTLPARKRRMRPGVDFPHTSELVAKLSDDSFSPLVIAHYDTSKIWGRQLDLYTLAVLSKPLHQ
jgi:hypothetical protein